MQKREIYNHKTKRQNEREMRNTKKKRKKKQKDITLHERVAAVL